MPAEKLHPTDTPLHQSFPGPVDRESFFAAQRRFQRRTWLIAVLCVLAILLMGLPLCAITAPLFWTLLFIGLDCLNLVVPIPDLLTPVLHAIERVVHGADDLVPLNQLLPFVLASLASGSLAFGAIWLGVYRVISRSGCQGILAVLAARAPRPTDFEERQLCNVVEEMALAAGLPAPQVMLVDMDIPNAAIIGNTPGDAIIVVSRRLLDDCDRNATQGTVAHLFASAGNGDLGISMMMLSVFVTLATADQVFSMSGSRRARKQCAAFLGRMLVPGRAKSTGHDQIADLLLAEQVEIDDETPGLLGGIRSVVRVPFLLVALSFMTAKAMFQLFVVGPMLSILWRQRKYLADATAVQLTRDPEGLGKALDYLAQRGGPIPGGHYLSHLFVVGAEAGQDRLAAKHAQEMATIREELQESPWAKRIDAFGRAYTASRRHAEACRVAGNQSTERQLGLAHALLPPVAERLVRLRRMGSIPQLHASAYLQAVNGADKLTVLRAGAMVLISLLLLALWAMAFAVVALSTLLGFGASMAIAMGSVALLHPLLRSLAGGG